MTAPQWAVRDFTRIYRAQNLKDRLNYAEEDYRTTMGDLTYFHPSELFPGEFDDEYILNNQHFSYVYANQATAGYCAVHRLLPSSSSN